MKTTSTFISSLGEQNVKVTTLNSPIRYVCAYVAVGMSLTLTDW